MSLSSQSFVLRNSFPCLEVYIDCKSAQCHVCDRTLSIKCFISAYHIFFYFSVFVQNRAVRDDFSLENYKAMQQTLEAVFNTSRLKITGNHALSPTAIGPVLQIILTTISTGTGPNET